MYLVLPFAVSVLWVFISLHDCGTSSTSWYILLEEDYSKKELVLLGMLDSSRYCHYHGVLAPLKAFGPSSVTYLSADAHGFKAP